MQAKIIKLLLTIISVAVSYFILGLVGLQLAVPPSQAGAIWPPAGLALTAMLIYGPTIWPGIFIGNFIISAWAFGFNPENFPIYIATGIGASLNAYISSKLIKKTIGFPNDLIKDRDIFLFFLIGGPLGCLISSSVGIGSMYAAKIISPSEIVINWAVWWAGDTIGVFIFTPILLTLFNKNSPVWKRRRFILTIPLSITFILVMLFFDIIQNQEFNRHYQAFSHESDKISKTIKNILNDDIRSSQLIYNYIKTDDQVNTKEFTLFSKYFLIDHPEIESINWFKYTNNQPSLIESINNKNNIHNSPPPINKIISKIKFQNNVEIIHHKNHVVIFKTGPTKINERDIIALSINISKLIDKSLEGLQFKNIDAIAITDLTTLTTLFNTFRDNSNSITKQTTIILGNLEWIINFGFNNHIDNSAHWTLWWVMMTGLFFVCLLGLGLLMLTGRYFSTEAIVNERTAQLQSAKNMAEASSQAKSRFISNISHELRTPLNGILGFTQILQKKPSLTDNDKKQISIIEHCSKHLLTLIDDLLDISRIETNKLSIQYKTVNIDDILDDIIPIFKLKAKEKGLSFNVNINLTEHVFYSDSKRIRQIIVNLLNNAIKFTNSGEINLNIHDKNNKLVIDIIDTGCGISEQNIKHIFSPFIQLNEEDYSKEGIGLGLSITQELIKLLGGSINVSSQLGKGSHFSVTIPLQKINITETKKSISTKKSINTCQNINILLAEDNEINILLLQNILDQVPCHYDVAKDGQEALNKLLQQKYHLALIDLNMPILSGLNLIKKIKQHQLKITTVAISAFAEQNKIDMALNSGFDYYLTKPIDIQQIINLVHTIQKKYDL